MYSTDLNTISYLDKLRLDEGIYIFRETLRDLAENDSEKAANLINEKNLRFSSLFLLKQEIEKNNLYSSLSILRQTALKVTEDILGRTTDNIEQLSNKRTTDIHSALIWIVQTGYYDDGLSDEFDEILDLACSLLIKTYRDKAVLPFIINMISTRYKNGRFIYDLVWVFFELRDRESLILIANLLNSAHQKDVELACKLLNFIPRINTRSSTNYQCFINWFNENYNFIYYTGESFNQTYNPKPYAVNIEAKYLCKAVPVDSEKRLLALTKAEHKLIDRFKKLSSNDKILLSSYSYFLYRQNPQLWKVWLHHPVTEQINIASSMSGGIL